MHYRSSQRLSTQQGPDRVSSRRSGVAARLSAFFDALARRPVAEIPLRTLAASDPNRHRRVRDDADLRIIELGLDVELRDARRSLAAWLPRALIRDSAATTLQAGPSSIQLTAAEVAAIQRGLDDALFAVILGAELPDDEADELLGGWSDLVPRRR
jgi:hypothetical protein